MLICERTTIRKKLLVSDNEYRNYLLQPPFLPANRLGSAHFSFIAKFPLQRAKIRCAVLPTALSVHQSPIMKLSYLQTLLLCFVLPITSACSSHSPAEGSPCGTCIQDHEVEGIAQRWLDAFATGGIHTLDSAVTENVRQILSPYIVSVS